MSVEAQAAAQSGHGSNRRELDDLLPLAYEQLRRMAHGQLRLERDGHTLSTTDLVHDTYVRLADWPGGPEPDGQFFALASVAMRRVLIEYARRHHAAKRGGHQERVSLSDVSLAANNASETLVALDEALTRLAALDARLAQVVECRYFGGLTEEETARALDVTARTVRRDWTKAKDWLYRELRD